MRANNITIHKKTGTIEQVETSPRATTATTGTPTIAGLVPVTDIMTTGVICANADVPLDAVVDLVVDNYIGCVPVVDDDGCPLGMLTKRDLVEPLASRARASAFAPRTAGEAMLPIAFTLDEHATVAQAATLMAVEDLHHIPVVSARGRVLGIVSSLDIVRWLARNDGHIPR